jgi:adenylate cyclase
MVSRPRPVESNAERPTLGADKLQILLDAADRLISTLSLDAVLAHILDIGGELTNSEAGSVILYDTEQENLYFAAATGPTADEVKSIRIPVGKGKAGMVFETGQSIVENVLKDHYKAVDEKTHFVTQSMICVPLRFGTKTLGVLQLMNKRAGAGDYDATDLELTQRLAVQATIAIRNATLFERLLSSSGLHAEPGVRQDLVPMVTGEAPQARIERATILFADMRGFRNFSGAVLNSPAKIQSYLTQFFQLLANSVLTHGGIVNKFLGDGLMAVFRGADSPLRAVQAAFHMREQFTALRREWQRGISRNLNFLDVGVGIATDEIMIGAIGDHKVSDFTIIGSAVNLAAALERQAREGRFILCDVCTYEAVQPWIGEFEGPLEISDYLIYNLASLRSALSRTLVFICHSSANIEAIRQTILPRLEKYGLEVFLAESSIKIGDKWDQAIVTAIDACDYFMIVMSKESAASTNVSDEVYYAFGQRQHRGPNWIMPVRLEKIEPSQIHWQLGRHQYRDLTTADGLADFDAVLKEFAAIRRQPLAVASPPATGPVR